MEMLSMTQSTSNEAMNFVKGGKVQLKNGRLDDAIASFRRAIELDPVQVDAHFLMAGAY